MRPATIRIRRFTRLLCAFSSGIAALLLGPPAGSAAPPQQEAAARLFHKLDARQPVQIVALGDTVTFGLGLADAYRECYAGILGRALGECFGGTLRADVAGQPECSADRALEIFPSHVRPRRPDLLLVELGRTDAQRKTDGYLFEHALRRLMDAASGEGAAVVLCVPPLDDNNEHQQVGRILRAVAADTGVPVADFNAALRERGYDSRGPFSWGQTPNEYAHVLFAKACWEALCRAAGRPQPLGVSVDPMAECVLPGTALSLHAGVEGGAEGRLKLWMDGLLPAPAPGVFDGLLAGTRKSVAVEARVPAAGTPARTRRYPLWAVARAGDAAGFDLKWLTLSPVLKCRSGAPPLSLERIFQPAPDLLHLTAANATIGRDMISGPDDLEAWAAVYRCKEGDRDDLRFFVRVRDDKVITEDRPEVVQNDAVELMLDARPADAQGKPYWEQGNTLIFVRPMSQRTPKTQMSALDSPPSRFDQVKSSSALLPDGYLVWVTIPMSVIHEWARGDVESIGFDLGIDDADSYHGRESQLIWAGVPADVTQPRMWGTLSWAEGDRPGMVRASVR